MLLFFHRGITEEGICGICNHFSALDKEIFITVLFEDHDDLEGVSTLEVQCHAANTLICETEWDLVHGRNVYTFWFDLDRITNRMELPGLPLTCTAFLDGAEVLSNTAGVDTSSLYHQGIRGGYRR